MIFCRHQFKEVSRGKYTFYFINGNLEDDSEACDAICYHCIKCGKRKVVRI